MPFQWGKNLGGGVGPGHFKKNAFWQPNTPKTLFDGPPQAPIIGQTPQGWSSHYAPQPSKPKGSSFDPSSLFASPSAPPAAPQTDFKAIADLFKNNGGLGGPPEPTNPHVSSSIPLAQMQQNYLPENVVHTGWAQQFSNLQKQANPAPMLEQVGATQDNMASAASGQYQPMIQAQMQDPLQKAAMLTGDIPVAADLERYNFGTKGYGAQSNEVQGLGNTANNWYGDRLNTWQQRSGMNLGLLNSLLG